MRAFVLLLALLLGLSSPALADDVAAAQSVIRAQEQAFSRDDAEAAYSHAAPEIRQKTANAARLRSSIAGSSSLRAKMSGANRMRFFVHWRGRSASSSAGMDTIGRRQDSNAPRPGSKGTPDAR